MAEPVLAPARMLQRHQPYPGREITPRSEGLWVGNSSDQSRGQHRTDARSFVEPPTRLIGSMPGVDHSVELQNLCLQYPQLDTESRQTCTGNLGQPLVICVCGRFVR